MSLITRNAKEYRVLSLRHPNHLVLAGSNNRNVIIIYRFPRTDAREGDTRGVRERLHGRPPENRFNSHSVSADISNWSRGSRGKN